VDQLLDGATKSYKVEEPAYNLRFSSWRTLTKHQQVSIKHHGWPNEDQPHEFNLEEFCGGSCSASDYLINTSFKFNLMW